MKPIKVEKAISKEVKILILMSLKNGKIDVPQLVEYAYRNQPQEDKQSVTNEICARLGTVIPQEDVKFIIVNAKEELEELRRLRGERDNNNETI